MIKEFSKKMLLAASLAVSAFASLALGAESTQGGPSDGPPAQTPRGTEAGVSAAPGVPSSCPVCDKYASQVALGAHTNPPATTPTATPSGSGNSNGGQ